MNWQACFRVYALLKIKIRGVSETEILEKPILGRKKERCLIFVLLKLHCVDFYAGYPAANTPVGIWMSIIH